MAEIPSSRKYGRGGASVPSPSPTPAQIPRATASTGAFTPASPLRPSPKPGNGLAWLVGLMVIGVIGWFIFSGLGRPPKLPYNPYSADRVVKVLPSTTVNARAGPGVEYPVITQVPPGTYLTAKGETLSTNGNTWVAIKSENDTVSYINAQLLTQQQ